MDEIKYRFFTPTNLPKIGCGRITHKIIPPKEVKPEPPKPLERCKTKEAQWHFLLRQEV